MVNFDRVSDPVEETLLVSFLDLTGYAKWVRSRDDMTAFQQMKEFFLLAGEAIQQSGGKVIKLMGDAILMAYPEEKIEAGILALADLKENGDRWLSNRGFESRICIKAHVGPCVIGQIGAPGEERVDIYGSTVNTCATMRSFGISISPQAFRSLSSDGRKRFKKHTPSIRYIGVDEAHRD